MLYAECVLECVDVAKTRDERIGETVGDLQAHADERGEYHKYRHLAVFEQLECIETKNLRDGFFAVCLVDADRIDALALPVLRHRIKLTYEAVMERRTPDDVIRDLLEELKSGRRKKSLFGS